MLPYLNHIAEDQDVTVRNVAVQILLDLCQMVDSQKCQDFLDIIEKVFQLRQVCLLFLVLYFWLRSLQNETRK